MKALIVYYSLNGNTEYVATQLAPLLNADTLRVNPIKEYPSSGFKKFLWAGNITPPIRSFIVQNRKELTGKRIAAVACQSGAGAEKAFHKLAEVFRQCKDFLMRKRPMQAFALSAIQGRWNGKNRCKFGFTKKEVCFLSIDE